MKKIILFLLVLTGTFISLAQQNNTGKSVYAEAQIETVFAEKGQTLLDIISIESLVRDQTDINPGEEPEGDFMLRSAFTNDGERFIVCNGGTNNVTVFDWETMQPIAVVNTGLYPNCIDVTDDYAIVGCLGGVVNVIDLEDYSMAGEFAWSGEGQAVAVKVSPDQQYAYIGVDVAKSLMVIDLDAMEISGPYGDFPVFLLSYSWVSTGGRSSFKHTSFEVSADGEHLIVGDGESSVLFLYSESGNIHYEVDGIPNCLVVGLSGDGSKTIALSDENSVFMAYQIDNNTHEITGSVDLSGNYMASYEVGVNMDGSKAFIGIGNNSSAIVRFDTEDYVVFTETYTPFWIGTSANHQYAINGQYRFSVLDFETEAIVGQSWGYTQDFGCVSPVGLKVVGYDPLRYEGVRFFDCSDPADIEMRGKTLTGWPEEGDTPYRISISDDGTRAVTSNSLSENMSIINLENYSVEAIIDLEEKSDACDISHDSQWAVMGGYDLNTIKIVDLFENELVATVATGQRPLMVEISQDDEIAVIGNLKGNSVSVVELNGENSIELFEVQTGVIGLSWAAFGVRSSVELDPTGKYILVAASFDDVVQVIDIEQELIVAELSVGDFPLKVAFNADGEYAAVTNYDADSFSIIHVDGEASSVVGTYSSNGDGPLRLDYNPVSDEFGIINYSSKTIIYVDPLTGDINSTENYSQYGYPIQLIFDNQGKSLVLTTGAGDVPGYLLRDGEAIELPATPTYFDYCAASHTAVVSMPGPDYVSVIEFDTALEPPLADFTANVTTIHVGESVEFTDQSVNFPDTWSWEFEGGTPANSNMQHPVIQYDEEGVFDVSLSVENANGSDTELKEDYITVLPLSMINNNGNDCHIYISPNPFSTFLTIDIMDHSIQDFQVGIFSIEGRLLKNELLTKPKNIIDVSDLENGLYLIKLNLPDGNRVSYKMLKQ